ncbi:MAG: hypothetical protein LC737_01720 [Chloroflexi bacterium]|nr:hypothetical protein [Chloroflexota bacterium]
MAHAYSVGAIQCGSLREQAAAWKQTRYRAFLDFCRSVYSVVMSSPSPYRFVNWYAAITQGSQRAARA